MASLFAQSMSIGRELRNVVQFGPLTHQLRSKLLRMGDAELRKAVEHVKLSELELFLSGQEHFDVPVYVAWGNQEDVNVLKKFANGSYHIPNLYLLNQDSSYTISFDGQTVRLFGLGGAFLYHRLFDIGHGTPTVSGAEGVMWTTLPQMGNLIQLSERYKDPSETRILVSHVCPGKEGLVSLLASALHVDFTISGALHGKFCHVYTDFSVRTLSNYLEHISQAQTEIPRLWSHVVAAVGKDKIKEPDFVAVQTIVEAVKRCPESENDLKHIWHLNLVDVKNGYAFLQLHGAELRIGTVATHGWTTEALHFKRRRSSTTRTDQHPHPTPHRETQPPSQVVEPTTDAKPRHLRENPKKEEIDSALKEEEYPASPKTSVPNPAESAATSRLEAAEGWAEQLEQQPFGQRRENPI